MCMRTMGSVQAVPIYNMTWSTTTISLVKTAITAVPFRRAVLAAGERELPYPLPRFAGKTGFDMDAMCPQILSVR